MTRILIGIPTMGSVHPLLVLRLITWAKEQPVEFYFTDKIAPVDRARNNIVNVFLEGDYTHLFFVDSDTIPPVDAITKLLAHDKPFVSGMTPICNMEDVEQYDNCFIEGKSIARRNGLQEIDSCGASCLLLKREVFKQKPYFRFIMNEDNTEQVKGEDLYFCQKAKESGITLFADTDVPCIHIKETALT